MLRRLTNLLMGIAVIAVQVGACQSQTPASTGEVADPDDGPTLLGLSKMLDHHLTRRGLVRADLEASTQTSSLAASYRAATEHRDLEAARTAHAQLLAALDAVARDPELPATKVARIEAKLAARTEHLPEARAKALRTHLDTLRAKLTDPAQHDALVTALSSLETQLER